MRAIFILADSTNRRFLNMYGSACPALTPNLDRLAARGAVFENHWCGSAPCMPARRDIMTGRLNFLEKPWGGVEPFDQTLPALLKTKNVYTRMYTDHYLYY
ncbi:MAG: sulfatase-like hydrolase/transferase, partial [Dysosmobacter sp.]|nr:sulfatase-like hydrolase/transferase [Dysosmobacter sp.]